MNVVDDSESVSVVGDQGDEKEFINTLLGEMKSQFNRPDRKDDGSIKTEENTAMDAPFGMAESDLSTNEDVSKESLNNVDILPQVEETSNDIGDQDDKPRIVLLFKKPGNESSSPSKPKDLSPGRRSLRNKLNSIEEMLEENLPKRSSRRRSKDCGESILQSAIARKEKSYNEANKPQRLTRQLKPTAKILENLALARQERTKLKSIKPVDKNLDDSDNESLNFMDNGLASTPKKSRKNIKYPKRKPKRLKTFHNVESEKETDSDQSLSPDQESNLDAIRNARRSQRISSRNKEDNDEPSGPSPNIADQAKDFPNDPECSSVGAELIASRLCLCVQKTKLFADVKENGNTVYCTAIDSIGEKLIGCTREVDVKETPLLRPSQRVPYLILCDLHRNRLLRHNCCPCGVFCTQGKFVECDANHQYHRSCQISVGSMECCPHCGLSTPSHDIVITMHCPKKPVFLPITQPIRCVDFETLGIFIFEI
ncbi:hypothetical protein NQ315_008492 [Exocentrus adspersus]|uniref:EHMT1/2 cysteine-rich region domain-containing protein n=1 Tax=Exocentrus adspersus TaxID=1586481 RepID=A0AAV8W750_9CUCU|nr:hypothetical protein NQ315_008492 [Exocentrus adspersus]